MKSYNYFLISALFLSLNISISSMGNSQVCSVAEQKYSNKDVRIFLKNFFEEDSQVHLLSKLDNALHDYDYIFDESCIAEKKVWIPIFRDVFLKIDDFFSLDDCKKELNDFLVRLQNNKQNNKELAIFAFVNSVVKELLK